MIFVNKKDIYGWPGYSAKAGDIELGVVPDLGGRIMSLKFQSEELFFVQPRRQGEVFDFGTRDLRAEKKKMGFRVWGGDKTWVAPEKEWWEKIPPLELDAGRYQAQLQGHSISMQSPVCRETGLRLTRAITLQANGAIELEQSITNESSSPSRWGLWNVTQILRPFDVYLPARLAQVRLYDEPSYRDCRRSDYLTELRPWVKVSCRDACHFKFGAMLDQGLSVLIKPLRQGWLALARSFSVDARAVYAHKAMAEIYNSPVHPYAEVEVHGPYVSLKLRESSMHRQTWTMRWFEQSVSPEGILATMSALSEVPVSGAKRPAGPRRRTARN